MKRKSGLTFIIAVLLLLGARAFAQEKPVILTAEASKTEITVGDPITYTVTAIYEKGYHVEYMPPGKNLGEFEIRDFDRKGPIKLDDGRTEDIFTYVIAVYDTGSFEIPPVQVSYWKHEDEKDIVETDKITIKVKSVRGKDARDIQDVKDPLSVLPNFLRYILLGAGILAALGAVTFLLGLLIRKIKEEEAMPPEVRELKIPPHVAARNALDEIEAKDLPGKGEIKQYYIEISDVIRQYLWRRFGVPTLERTTAEIIPDLRGAGVPGGVDPIEGLLRDSDLVKFAKYRPDMGTCREALTHARRIIDATAEEAA